MDIHLNRNHRESGMTLWTIKQSNYTELRTQPCDFKHTGTN